MDKRTLLMQFLAEEITLDQFKDMIEILQFEGNVPLSYWIEKTEWVGNE